MILYNLKEYGAFLFFCITAFLMCLFSYVPLLSVFIYSFLLTGVISAGNGLFNLIRDCIRGFYRPRNIALTIFERKENK